MNKSKALSILCPTVYTKRLKLALAVLVLYMGLLGPAWSAQVGVTAPDFTLNDEMGNTVSLGDFAGNGVILDFCACWCPSCQYFYADIYPTLASNSLLLPILVEDAGGNPADQADAMAWDNMYLVDQVLHVSGDVATKDALLNDYLDDLGAIAFPTFVFIDANLVVVGNMVGMPDFSSVGSAATWNGNVAAIEASRVIPLPPALWLFSSALAFFGWRVRRPAIE